MKAKIILIALSLGFAMAANAQKKIETSELPKAAQDFLKEHFSHTSITVAKKDSE